MSNEKALIDRIQRELLKQLKNSRKQENCTCNKVLADCLICKVVCGSK